MPLAPTSHRGFSYIVTVPPAELAVSLQDVKDALKIDGTADDDFITLLIESATTYAEQVTGRWFIKRTCETYRDHSPSKWGYSEGYYHSLPSWKIRRSPLDSVDSIEYISEGVYTELDSANYYHTTELAYSHILAEPDTSGFPHININRMQMWRITFIAGMADDESGVPAWAKTAIMMHVVAMYHNRGDCLCGDATGQFMPSMGYSILLQNRIEEI